MPGRTSFPSHVVSSYTSPSSLPPSVWHAFHAYQQNSNIMYPHALKSLRNDHHSDPISSPRQCWITLATKSRHDADFEIELVLSCTSWALGDYPIFIFTTVPFATLSLTWLQSRIQSLVVELAQLVPLERVYSVFAPAPISKTFVRAWQQTTGASPIDKPYYAASLSYCTRQSFRHRPSPFLPGLTTYTLRRAEESDIPQTADLCKGFAATSEPFVLDDHGAIKEATELTRNNMLWVHEIQHDGVSGIASIVATTRQSEHVSAITKVFTNPRYRSRGCAERLVRRVCQSLLFKEQKQSVVLFVAHDNLAAAKVYDRVGFVGLCGKPRVEGVDPWVEIGFHDSNLGHW